MLLVAFKDDAHARFDRERFAMGAVSGHPNIVDVYTSGYDELGRPYLVMALMNGGSFGDRIRRRGGMSWQAAVDVAVKLAGALETAHRAGVLHRDIKPENVLMSAYGEPQLADFGISRIDASSAADLRQRNHIHSALRRSRTTERPACFTRVGGVLVGRDGLHDDRRHRRIPTRR